MLSLLSKILWAFWNPGQLSLGGFVWRTLEDFVESSVPCAELVKQYSRSIIIHIPACRQDEWLFHTGNVLCCVCGCRLWGNFYKSLSFSCQYLPAVELTALNKVGPFFRNTHGEILNPLRILCTYMAVNTSKLFSVQQMRVFSKDLPLLYFIVCADNISCGLLHLRQDV